MATHHIVCFLVLIVYCTAFCPSVRTEFGSVVGTRSSLDSTVYAQGSGFAFLGIPYAEAPLKSRRFQKPVPKKPWSNFFDATTFGAICPQPNALYEYSEDCLTLNIFTPDSTTTNHSSLLPVLVYIHGGSLHSGSAREMGKDGIIYNLNQKEIIVVTIQYRLGFLGFFAPEQKGIPKNLGLHDQILALEWIQKNIVAFGGDNSRVTLSGNSAGACSVSALNMSPYVRKDLFQQVILQSGTANLCFGSNEQKEATLLQSLCGKEPAAGCLEQMAVEQIVKFDKADMDGWKLSLDRAILPEQLDRLILRYATNRKVLLGSVKDEWANVEVETIHSMDFNLSSYTQNSLSQYISDLLVLLGASSEKHSAVLSIYQPDFNRIILNSSQCFQKIVEIASDAFFVSAISKEAEMLALHNEVLLYQFSYVSTSNEFYSLLNVVGHAMELPYLFMPENHFKENANKNDWKMAGLMSDLWTNFVKSGVPLKNAHPLDISTLSYININTEVAVKEGYATNARELRGSL